MNYPLRIRGVRRPADWMVPADDRILEILDIGDERYKMPANMIQNNIGISSDWTYKRLRQLVSAGLVKRTNSMYLITDLGEAYLDGTIKGNDIPEPEMDDV